MGAGSRVATKRGDGRQGGRGGDGDGRSRQARPPPPHPLRYVATFGDSERVEALTYAAAAAHGEDDAREQLALGVGADWIKTQTTLRFPEAVGIRDWAHVARRARDAPTGRRAACCIELSLICSGTATWRPPAPPCWRCVPRGQRRSQLRVWRTRWPIGRISALG